MLEFDVVDKGGEWFVGRAPLGLRDPFTGVSFQYNRPVKVTRSDWVAIQLAAGALAVCKDPLSDEIAKVPVAQTAAKAK